MKELTEHAKWEWKPHMTVFSETTNTVYVLDDVLNTIDGVNINDLIKSESIFFPTDNVTNIGFLLEMIDEFNPLISVLSRNSNRRYTVWCRPQYRCNYTVGVCHNDILGLALAHSLISVWNDYAVFDSLLRRS